MCCPGTSLAKRRVVYAIRGRMLIESQLVAAAICGVGVPLKDHGLGKNIWTVPFSDITLIKLSMLFLYLRLFPNTLLRKAVFVSLAITSLWAIGSFLAQVLSCKPISYYWNQWDGEHEGRCASHNSLLLAHSIINIFLDVLVIALPMPVLVKLQMSIEKRVGMCLMFAVGLVYVVFLILRQHYSSLHNSFSDRVPSEDFVPVGVWSLLEIDVGIMCSCMPGIRALTKRLYSTLFKTDGQPSSGYRYGSRQSKPGSGGSGSGSAHRVQSSFKSGSSNSNAGGGGQFIRLKEVDSREVDTTNHLWPLREFPAVTVPPKDSVRVTRADVQTQGHPWQEYSDDSKPSPLLPPARYEDPRAHYCLFSKAAIARASKGSSHFTWFRDGDSTYSKCLN
ncbi:hypothetical protein AN6415.2 [Aspergillus nidulans FGSC A4]|uniref:Rhodopsin domain-containing protein n=1 Tax=Emericella nidulans (strain FGSC A4 / ATCC 38163 / CBS 112.46 / NRRL 194 / M139) TaxID=227321 RepID=Q5AZ65_EMENI|nr:hypothetical protein [Aspergillus nidulans FGSC A4]EAA58437.1 hypothetical protein AN6415.2 [Aspergillus nidulans FGSC A4]CBF69517.1 TPA: conserved hypothetical protein [Aspergillus nidulans FGSC A4]|eukprot:XP_664019.1 hypothetical protein AN6415.2 [Aspergillus nidulans FGSC A4]